MISSQLYVPLTSVSRGGGGGQRGGLMMEITRERMNRRRGFIVAVTRRTRCEGDGGPARRATGRACILNYPHDYRENWDHC